MAFHNTPHKRVFHPGIGITQPAFGRIIRASFSLLGRMAYFTCGADEGKSWVIPAGSKAPKAAAVIHNDFERGFIKAEVASFSDFQACGSTFAGAKAAAQEVLAGFAKADFSQIGKSK